MYLEAFIIFET